MPVPLEAVLPAVASKVPPELALPLAPVLPDGEKPLLLPPVAAQPARVATNHHVPICRAKKRSMAKLESRSFP
jgi:hypothetical protein